MPEKSAGITGATTEPELNEKELAVILPVYNEEGAIELVINSWTQELEKIGMNFEIHAYNDGSKDRSLAILRELQKENEHLVVHDKANSGHGSTILQGYRENCDATWIFQVDSDNEMKPDLFHKLWMHRDSHDFILGRRFMRTWPLARKIMSSTARSIVNMFYDNKVYDVNCPYRLMRVEHFRPAFFSIPKDTFAPNLIITGYSAKNKLKTAEIDVPYQNRVTGEVSIRKFKLLKGAIRSFLQTISYRLRRYPKLSRQLERERIAAAPVEESPDFSSIRLYSQDDCEGFDIGTIHDLYRAHVNSGQVDLISTFGFGRDTIRSAEGMRIKTTAGREILDFTGGIGVLNHGHNHPRILKARQRYQADKKMEVHKNFFSPWIAGLSHNIARLLPGDLDISYFCNSGAEAVEGALKMAYKFHGGNRSTVLHADISFHGKTMGAASVTGSPELTFSFPQIPGAAAFEYDNLDSLKQLLAKHTSSGDCDVYAVLLEPINASSVRQCSKEFLVELRRICDENKIILIFDEVYTGWAKCGELFAFMKYGIEPDIVTYAKSFGGGKASISGYTARTPVFQKAYGSLEDATLHSTTYNGLGEETVTALEAIKIIVDDDYVGRSRRIHRILSHGLGQIRERYPDIVSEVRGAGSLNGILLKPSMKLLETITKMVPSPMFRNPRFLSQLATAAVISHMYNEYGILTFYGSNRDIPLVVSPSLIATDGDLEYFLNSLDQTLARGLPSLITDLVEQKVYHKLSAMTGGRILS